MFGIGILVALGRRVATAALADTGLLPAGFYRHLALAALEEEDFPRALQWLPFARDPVLTQLLVLRLRLLAARHNEQRQAVLALLTRTSPRICGAGARPSSSRKTRPRHYCRVTPKWLCSSWGNPGAANPAAVGHPSIKTALFLPVKDLETD